MSGRGRDRLASLSGKCRNQCVAISSYNTLHTHEKCKVKKNMKIYEKIKIIKNQFKIAKSCTCERTTYSFMANVWVKIRFFSHLQIIHFISQMKKFSFIFIFIRVDVSRSLLNTIFPFKRYVTVHSNLVYLARIMLRQWIDSV